MGDPHQTSLIFRSPSYGGALKKVLIPPNGRGVQIMIIIRGALILIEIYL